MALERVERGVDLTRVEEPLRVCRAAWRQPYNWTGWLVVTGLEVPVPDAGGITS